MKRASSVAPTPAVGGVLVPVFLVVLGGWLLFRWAKVDVLDKTARLGWLLALALDVAAFTVAAAGSCLRGIESPRWRGRLVGTIMATGMTIGLLMLAEITLMYVPRSHSVGTSLASISWFAEYWQVNAAGFREREVTADLLAGRKTVAVIGDSFVAGHGIAQPADRFTNQLEDMLGDDWRVLNYGVNGADSRLEFQVLKRLPFQPDVVVLAYFGNDILEAAVAAGKGIPPVAAYANLSVSVRRVVTRSYLLNFIYWAIPQRELAGWWSFYQQAYRDPELRRSHVADLSAMVDYSRRIRVPLVVVIFPYLHDIAASQVYVPLVRDCFASQGIPVLEVEQFIGDLNLSARVVNKNDVHPSSLVHRRVAEKLEPLVRTSVAKSPR